MALVDGLHAEVQAGHAEPQVRLLLGHDQGPVRPGAAHHRGARGRVEARGVERPGPARPPGLQAADEARVFQRAERLEQHVGGLARGREHVDGRQDPLDPCLVPGFPVAISRAQRLDSVASARRVDREDGPGRPRTEVLQGGLSRQPPASGARRQPCVRDVASDGAPVLHAPQDAEQQRTHRGRAQIAQPTELLPDAQVCAAARLLQGLAVRADRGGAGPFQGAADGRPVAEFGQGVPAQPLGDGPRQSRAGRQAVLALQRHEVAPPQPVGCDELADEALVVERPGVDPRIAPPRLHPLGEVRQGDAVVTGRRPGRWPPGRRRRPSAPRRTRRDGRRPARCPRRRSPCGRRCSATPGPGPGRRSAGWRRGRRR